MYDFIVLEKCCESKDYLIKLILKNIKLYIVLKMLEVNNNFSRFSLVV